jgi:hypothetical protein
MKIILKRRKRGDWEASVIHSESLPTRYSGTLERVMQFLDRITSQEQHRHQTAQQPQPNQP